MTKGPITSSQTGSEKKGDPFSPSALTAGLFRGSGDLGRMGRLMRVGGDGFPKGGPEGELALIPAWQAINRWFAHEEKDHHHHQERAEHQAQDPGRRHVMR